MIWFFILYVARGRGPRKRKCRFVATPGDGPGGD
jgi:hypothetical protein